MIRLTLFGGPELFGPASPDAPAVLGRPKRLALLVYLALAGPASFRSRDAALALFWPESDRLRARHSLNQELSRLRRSLGAGVIATRGGAEVGIAPGALWCDAVAFAQALKSGDAEEALHLYRGDLLPGFFVDDAPDFERWLDEQRTRFKHEARDAAWRLAESAERHGEPVLAARWARRSSELSHDDETSLQELLRLLDRTGDLAGALHAYKEFAARLEKDFEAVPSAETRRLIAAIRERAGSVPDLDDAPLPAQYPTSTPRSEAEMKERASLLPVVHQAAVAPASSSTSVSTSPLTPAALAVGSARQHAMRRSLLWLVAGAMMIASLAGLSGLLHYTLSHGRGPTSTSRVRIAVNDFTDLTAPSRRGVFGPAITAAVVDKLTAVRSFDVASASIPGPPHDDDLRGSRSPRFVVTGSVLRSGGRVRVNVELIDATAGSTLGTAVLEHESSEDSMALVDALSGDVSSAIRVAIGRELRSRDRYVAWTNSRARRLAEEASAERDMARDLEREGRFSTAARALGRADSLLASAEAITPGWREPMIERAHVAWELAVLHLTTGSRDVARADTLLRKGIAEAERAVAADSTDATTLETLGLLSYWYWLQIPLAPDSTRAALERARSALRSAVAMDPGRASAWNLLSAALYSQADYKGAYLAAYRAYRADAYLDDAEEVLSRLFASAYEIGDDVGARRWCDEINHRFYGSWTSAYCRLGLLAWGSSAGDPAAARQAWALAARGGRHTALVREMGPRLYMLFAASLARAGLRDSAEAIIHRSRASAAGDPEILPLEASARIILGQPDSAVARLAQYVRAKPLHRTAVACSRRFAGLRALDRESTVFRPCGL